jgi:hypothetical protein
MTPRTHVREIPRSRHAEVALRDHTQHAADVRPIEEPHRGTRDVGAPSRAFGSPRLRYYRSPAGAQRRSIVVVVLCSARFS